MPFLNPPDVLPEAMRFIVRVLLARGEPVSEEELLKLVAPLGLVEAISGTDSEPARTGRPVDFKTGGRTIAEKSLAAMRNAGLLSQETRGDRLVTVASPIQQGFPTWQAVTAPAFAAFLRRISLASTRDLLDDNVESGGAEDLAFAVALLFSMPNPLQPIASFEPGAEKTLADYQTEQFGDDIGNWIVRNGERYAPLLRWVTYLGFGRILNLGRGRSGLLLVDPSEALRHLAVPLLDSQTRIADFLVRLGSAMPYSDQGGIGASLRGRLREEPTDDSLSPGLALGLQVLYLRKELQLTLLSDAESMAFPIDVGRVLRYSHIGPGSSQ